MSLRAVGAILVAISFSAGWAISDAYYLQMRRQGKWFLRGEGILWDTSWVFRHIRAVEADSPSEWMWNFYQTLREQGIFEHVRFIYTGRGDGYIYARTRRPMARVRLPLREYYIDAEGKRLPFVQPSDLPIIEAPRWDSTAFGLILGFFHENPIYQQLVSRLYQDSQGIWHAYLETSSEVFIMGKTEHLPIALKQLGIYLRLLSPYIGGHTCKTVLLHIPDQIVCQ
ncbi:MAG: hypothetical protein N2253_02760 [Bacteroidia bacterium]|nr:hypothetical protein [Bacteroidia bacterium]